MASTHDHHDHHHGHHHDDDHARTFQPDHPDTEYDVLEQALRELLIEKGLLTARQIQQQIDSMDSRGIENGQELVARAWTDPAYKARLIAEPMAVIRDMGIDMEHQPEVKVVENTDAVHNVIVCTLCSCYPRSVLGIPPAWYKKKAYRARVVVEPRQVLREFGTDLPDTVEVRVHDSTADLRYIVLPQQPAGTEGWSKDALKPLVTRDALIGVAPARLPAA
ncbi:MAG: nitrile hydratase subunit alpha [Alphaproteobacteria bacterium]|nr:nitrile hydratase subunit alpha [Alphaproteobacteria bacterium]MCB9929553.1 nitrile hydratase subunit alpha [Alphaproteobacteria bacterium]